MKKKNSSLIKLLLTLALVAAALLPQRAEAASSSLSGDSTVQAGSTVTLTFSISGSNVMGVEATLEYDSNTLEFTNYDQKISGWTMDYSSNHFLLYGVSNPINSSTSVLSVTFRVKSGLDSGTKLTAGFKNIIVLDRFGGDPAQQQLRPELPLLLQRHPQPRFQQIHHQLYRYSPLRGGIPEPQL